MAINLPNYERQTEILQNTNDIKATLPTLGKTKRTQTFTASGSWTAPQGVTTVCVTGGGAGGGGAVAYGGANANTSNGTTGGATSFGNLLTLSGGGGGRSSVTDINVAYGGIAGGPGGQPGEPGKATQYSYGAGDGGGSGIFFGGRGMQSNTAPSNAVKKGGSCSGGGGAVYIPASETNAIAYAGGGGGGEFVHQFELNTNPSQNYTITIGKGGISSTVNSINGGVGGDGYLRIEWYE